MELCELILASLSLPERFSYGEYPPAFAAFEREAAPFLAALDPRDAATKAAALITRLEESRQSLSRREARERSEREKSVLALFLAPAALRAEKGSQTFAAELSRQWNERYPRNRFFPGSYESIMKGFDANLLGLPLRKK